MSWISLRQYLFPQQELEDPRFRAEIERLAITGLRVIGGICVGVPIFVYTLGVLWFPELPALSLILGDLAQFLIGLIAIGLSFLPRVASHARSLGILVGGFTAFSQTASMMQSSDFLEAAIQTSPEQHLPIILTIVMLIGIVALPIKPLHAFGLGTAITALFMGVTLSNKGMAGVSGWAGMPLLLSIMVVLISTGLTAVMYHQRASAFQSRRRAEEHFEELKAAQATLLVAQNAASQTRFAAAMSHDLNSPLGSLSAAFETLVKLLQTQPDHLDRDRKRGKAFEEATRSGRAAYERLNQIAERMRHLTNLDRAEERAIDLNELCTDTVAFFQAKLEGCARVSLNLSPLPLLKCRPQQISAVLSNLLRNAAEASKEEDTISVVSARRSGEIVVEVRDDGRGIAAGRLPTLFEPEFHVEGGRVTTTNWGLFVSRSIVAEHGGSIQIESELGQGTTARVLLPIPSRS